MDKDFISLLYIHDDSRISLDLTEFSRSRGIILTRCEGFEKACDHAESKPPDLILIDVDTDKFAIFEEGMKALGKIKFHFKPGIFLVLSDYPESEKRMQLMHSGCDEFLISPFTLKEVQERFFVYHQLKYYKQKTFIQDSKLEKTFGYLDRFKKELKTVKTQLYEERISLNNALKQVTQMTRERRQTKKQIKQIKTLLHDNLEGLSDLLVNLIQTRVEKNKGHGHRVARIAKFIGRQLKLGEKNLEDIGKAALLHEVGLLLVPGEILLKPENTLLDYEKDFFIHYPVKGADLLLNCSQFENCAQIIRHLNENCDGTGRPLGLKRKFIPLLSRILTGADVLDELKDKKEVSSLEILLEKLEELSGTRLDPVIVAWLEKYAVLHMGSDSYRVKGVGIHQLEPGMTLGTALFTNTGTKLFSVNTLLTSDAIDKVRKYNREYPVDEIVYIRT